MRIGENGKVKLMAALLALVCFVLYFPVYRFGFVGFDDPDYVYNNSMVVAGWSWNGLRWAMWGWHAANWHPLTWLSHMSDCQFFGLDAGKHHLVNVFFHSLNSALVFVVLRLITGSFWRSAFAAAFFGLHPLRIESVAWVSERKDVLSGFFFLATLYIYSRYVNCFRAGGGKAKVIYISALVCFAFGLMSKSMVVTLPFVLLLLDLWPLKRIAIPEDRKGFGCCATALINNENRTVLLEKVPFLILAIFAGALTFFAQKADSVVSLDRIPIGCRIENAFLGWLTYIGRIVWPHDLCFLYLYDLQFSWLVCVLAGGALAAISFAVIRFWRCCPFLATGWFWFVGMLVPVIGIVQVGNQATADRYTYLPSIGLSIAVVWGAWELAKRMALNRGALIAVFSLLLLVSAVLTRQQLEFWRDTQSLMEQALRVNPANHIALNNSGYDFYLQGKYELAEERLRRAVQARPSYLAGWNNLALVLCKRGKVKEGVAYFQTALSISPGDSRTLAGYGGALLEAGHTNEAEVVLRDAAAKSSNAVNVLLRYANLLDSTGKQNEAVPVYERILEKQPCDSSVHHLLAGDLLACRRIPEALMHYAQAVTFNSENASLHADFASALDRAGQPADAVAQWLEALRLEPDNLSALKGLAWFRAMTRYDQFRNPAEAVLLASQACQLTGNTNTFCLGLLDTAYAESGRFEDAIATATRVRDLAIALQDTQVCRLAEMRIQAYEQKRSLRPKQP